MGLAEIVNVSITRETKAVSQAGFSSLLILGQNGNFSTRVQEFSEIDATLAAALVGGSAAAEYKAAVDALSQNPRLVTVKIGQVGGTRKITDDAGTWTAAGSISCKINGVTVSQNFSSDKDTSMAAFAAKIALEDNVASAVYTGSTSHWIVITMDSGFVLSVTDITVTGITGTMAAFTLSATETEDHDAALDEIVLEDDDWYGLVDTSRTEADLLDVAAWVETKKKIFFVADNDADTVNTTDAGDTTTFAAQVKAAGYTRTAVFYSGTVADYPDAAGLGKILPYDPGSYTMKFKTLASITADSLTETQSGNARDKNVNTLEEIGGVNIVREGTVAEGEFIDTIIFIDWLQARITEEVYGVLVKNIKVPYTNIGTASIRSAVEKPLKIGQNRGGISEYAQDDNGIQIGGYAVGLPAFSDISSNDKAARTLNDVTFTAFLAGAIHAVSINGIVTV